MGPATQREVDMNVLLTVLILLLGVIALLLGSAVRVVRQYERGLVFRFGRVHRLPRDPGLTVIIPGVDHMRKVNMQIVTLPVPGQDAITRDNVTVRVDAVVYFNVVDPVQAIVGVEDYRFAVGQVAQTSLRSIIGKSNLDDLLSNREQLNEGLEIMIDSPALQWGVHIHKVEIKDVVLPEAMKRAMSRQAEAERERRGRVISSDGELQASKKLAQAAETMADTPSALQLRLLETVVEVAAEKNSTLVLPFPVELLRFLDAQTRYGQQPDVPQQARPPAEETESTTPEPETSPGEQKPGQRPAEGSSQAAGAEPEAEPEREPDSEQDSEEPVHSSVPTSLTDAR